MKFSARVKTLTPKDISILQHLADGKTQIETRNLLGLSKRMLEYRLTTIKAVIIPANNTVHLIAEAVRKGIID